MKIAIALLALALAACDDPLPNNPTPDQRTAGYHVEYAFSVEGCSVYSFHAPNSYEHFVTTCRGSTASQIHMGKTSRPDDIQTVEVRDDR